MKDIIKGLWKWIFWIFILLVIGAGILALRIFVIDKDYNSNASKNSDATVSSSNYGKNSNDNSAGNSSNNLNGNLDGNSNGDSNGSSSDGSSNPGLSNTIKENGKEIGNKLSDLGKKAVDGAKAIGNATVRGYKEDEEVYTYNEYNFDNFFLLYEGEQTEREVKVVLEHLIDDSKWDFYARTSVTAVNFGDNAEIRYNGDVTQFQNELTNLENSVSEGKYEISFKYALGMAYVNEIVITKK